jgi:hypothetical protein
VDYAKKAILYFEKLDARISLRLLAQSSSSSAEAQGESESSLSSPSTSRKSSSRLSGESCEFVDLEIAAAAVFINDKCSSNLNHPMLHRLRSYLKKRSGPFCHA